MLVSAEDAAGVQTDAGLQFGGRVRLLLLAASLPTGRLLPLGMQASGTHKPNQDVQIQATVLAVPPNQLDQFIVAGSTDQIMRGSLYGQALVPKVGYYYFMLVFKQMHCLPRAAIAAHIRPSEVKLHQQVTA